MHAIADCSHARRRDPGARQTAKQSTDGHGLGTGGPELIAVYAGAEGSGKQVTVEQIHIFIYVTCVR